MVGRERTFNYPKHPLFGIAPILYNWRGDPRHDEYTSRLVGRIRAGRYSSDLWDCNSLYLDYGSRVGAPAYQQVEESKKSKREAERLAAYLAEVTAEEEQERLALKAELEASRVQRKARKAAREQAQRAWEEEQERVAREVAAKQAENARRRAEQDAEWERLRVLELAAKQATREREQAERVAASRQRMENALGIVGFAPIHDSERRVEERAKILAAPWQCKKCLKPAAIALHLGKYQLVCRSCAFSSVGDHETLIKLVQAQAA